MTLTFRLIAKLDIRNEHLIKTVRLEGVRKVGDPAEYASRYDAEGIDEIIYMDAVASLYGRNSLGDLVFSTAEECFVPVTVCGGIDSVGCARDLLRLGADRLAVNTAAIKRPELITELANKFGSQAVVLQLDAKRKNGSWEAYCDGGRQPTAKSAVLWARDAVAAGAGEILLTSIDFEGTRMGVDYELCSTVAKAVRVPVVLAGGVGSAVHVVEAAKAGASGVAMAGVLHYNRVSLTEMRGALREAGVAVRC